MHQNRIGGTYRTIKFPFVIHPQIESTVHPSNADQSNCKADEFQNTWERRQNIKHELLSFLVIFYYSDLV